MVLQRRALLAFALTVVAAAALGATARAAAVTQKARLASFNSCPALLTYAKSHATPYVDAYGFGKPAATVATGVPTVTANGATSVPYAAPASAAAAEAATSTATTDPVEGVDYSGTNDQEADVDEPDMVKTNGTTLFAVEGNQLNAVDVSGAQPKLLDTLTLDGWSHELLLYGTHLLVLSRGGYWVDPLPALSAQMLPIIPSDSVITEIDVSNPSSMQVVNTLTLNGSYVDARMVGSTVRIVSSSQMPLELPFATPANGTTAGLAAATTANRSVVASSKISAWLPTYQLGSGPARSLVQCRNVLRPVQFSGLGMLTVLTIDLSQGLTPVDSVSVMTDGRIVYASPTSLYVTTESWADRPSPLTPTVAPSSAMTTIDKFDISDPTKTVYMGSATVRGYLLDQWSLSDFQSVLRVVSTDTPAWWGSSSGADTQSYLTTFQQGDGGLVQVGQVGGLGQGDQVNSVRFDGDVGYVSTFNQVDPLYTLDLSDPANPKIAGQVTIPGYSSYLQPVGDNLLLGLGQDVDPTSNEPTGTQVSLFDVSDLAHPTRLFHYSLGQGWSEAESDSHAFLYWPPTGLVVVPFGQQAVAMHVSRTTGITELGRVVQTDADAATLPEIDRSVVVGNSLLTVSDAGVEASSLTSFATLGWAAFPAPAPVPIQLPGPEPLVPGVGASSTAKAKAA